MRKLCLYVALVLGVAATPMVARSKAVPQSRASCPADPDLANLVAGSDLILAGKFEGVRQRLLEEARKKSPDYLDIPVKIDDVLKGGATGAGTFRFYPKDRPNAPSNAAVIGLEGAPAILFLTRADDGPVGFYFAGDSTRALQPATEEAIGAAREEVERQSQIIQSWRKDATLPYFAKVQSLIAKLGRVRGDEQQWVFAQLEKLGQQAVPAIVAQMDNRRHLLTQEISLVNHASDAFEGTRHYRPEQVVDGLDAVLNQMTGASFGFIGNGGSDRQRVATVAGWRIYSADLVCRRS